MKNLLLWGARSQARVIHQMILDGAVGEARVAAIFDRTVERPGFETEARFFTDYQALLRELSGISHYVICIGNEFGYARFKTHEVLAATGLSPLSVVSEHAILDTGVDHGDGLIAMPGTVVHKFSSLGAQCIVNTNAIVDHECVLGNGVHIMGGAALAGRVTVGDFATVGLNASILPDITVGEGAYIGAGAVVTRDVPPMAVVVGVPARRVRESTLVWHDEEVCVSRVAH